MIRMVMEYRIVEIYHVVLLVKKYGHLQGVGKLKPESTREKVEISTRLICAGTDSI